MNDQKDESGGEDGDAEGTGTEADGEREADKRDVG